jgi:hypothetical protein
MNKFIQPGTDVWLRLVAVTAAVFAAARRAGTACFAKVCGPRANGPGKSCEIGRAAAAGMILFGIAGAGMSASGGIAAYGVASSAAGVTVAVGWEPYWLLWMIVLAAIGAAAGAASAYLARLLFKQRGAAVAVLFIGAVGGVLTGATWGSAVARDCVVEVRAQTASATPMIVGQGTRLSVVNGPVRLTGSVARDTNGLMLTFMLGAGALVGVLAARGLSGSPHRDEPAAPQPFQPQAACTA